METVFVFILRRSGSSMVLGILHILGIDLGSPLKEADDRNVKGYFENENVLKIRRWLHAHGMHRFKVSPESRKWSVPQSLLDAYSHSFRRDFRATKVNREIADVLSPVSGKIHVIILLREPRAQMESTRNFLRGNFDEPLLWRCYAERVYSAFNWALKHGCPILVLDYDLILCKPRREIERIAAFLGLHVDGERIREAANFVDRRLKNY